MPSLRLIFLAVLQLRYGGKTVLLGSDVDRLGWTLLRDRGEDLRADVYEAVHHGAAFPEKPQAYQPAGRGKRRPLLTMPELLELVNPELVLLSVGTTNPHGHPHPTTLTALRQQGQRGRSLRLIGTQLTPRCHDRPAERRALAFELLPTACQGGLSSEVPTQCPCGGTIVVTLHEDGTMDIQPPGDAHARFIDSLDHPGCREPAREQV